MAAPAPAGGVPDRPTSPNPEPKADAAAPAKPEPKKDAAPAEPAYPAPAPPAKPAAQASPSSPPVFQTQIKWVQLLQQLFAGLMQEAAAGTGSSPHVAGAKTLASGLEKTRLANEELISRLQSSLLKVKEESHENDKLLYAPFSERNLFVGAVNSFVVSLPLVLTPLQLRSLSAFVADSVVAALRSLLHLPATWSGQFSLMPSHGFARLLRAALATLAPAVDPSDFEALNSLRPVVYTTSESFLSARLWPFSHLHQLTTVDAAALDTLFASHTAAKRTPFLLLLSLASVPLETMAKLAEVCKRHKVWLHIDADHTVAELTLEQPAKYQAMTNCNSLSFAPGQHIYDLPVSAFVTLFAQPVPVDPQGSGLEPVNALQQSLSLYLFMLRFGSEALQQVVHRANSIGQAFATATGANPLLHFQISATPSPLSVAFRYIPVNTDHASVFVNRVNKQLLLDLSEHAVPLGIDVLYAKAQGAPNATLFLHFNALQFAWESQADAKQAQALVEKLHTRLAVETNLIDSTLAHRPVFEEEISGLPALTNVQVDRFLGLGAVKFFPPWLSSTGAVASEIKKELDAINTALAVRLQEQVQGLFAEARDVEGYSCVLVGVDSVALTADRARAYAQMVRTTAEALQPSKQLASNLSALVQKGIREAEEQLNREMGAQKGLMRKIPVVGSLLNWWSPNQANVTGRAFDLASSSVQTVKKSSSTDLSLVGAASGSDVVRRSESASAAPAGSVQRLLSSSSDNRLPQYAPERRVALRAVQLAAKVTASVQEQLISADTVLKKDRSPVTVADLCSQAIIIRELQAAFPDDAIVAEESGKTLTKNPELKDKVVKTLKTVLGDLSEAEVIALIDRGAQPKPANAQRWWTLDPVDGTLGFLRKEQYAIALALMANDQPVLGVLGCPNLPLRLAEPNGPRGCVLVAVRGQGAFMAPLADNAVETAIHCSQETDPARLVHTTSVESGHSFADVTNLITQAMGVQQAPIKLDSQCKYAVVARGDSHVYLRLSDLTYREHIWDHAAGVIIVEEAGGRVSDMNGKPLDFSKGRTLAENLGVVCAANGVFKEVHRAVQQANPVAELKRRAEAAAATKAADAKKGEEKKDAAAHK